MKKNDYVWNVLERISYLNDHLTLDWVPAGVPTLHSAAGNYSQNKRTTSPGGPLQMGVRGIQILMLESKTTTKETLVHSYASKNIHIHIVGSINVEGAAEVCLWHQTMDMGIQTAEESCLICPLS